MKRFFQRFKTKFVNAFCHRTLYGGLAACSLLGCALTSYPELYAAKTIFYLLLAALGSASNSH